jgi:hypothetical protein
MAVGVAAAGYHGVSPSNPLRPLLRKFDYYSICYCSNVLRRAAHIGLPAPLQVAALLTAPVKPTAVTGLNLLLVEVSNSSSCGCRGCIAAAGAGKIIIMHVLWLLQVGSYAGKSACHRLLKRQRRCLAYLHQPWSAASFLCSCLNCIMHLLLTLAIVAFSRRRASTCAQRCHMRTCAPASGCT